MSATKSVRRSTHVTFASKTSGGSEAQDNVPASPLSPTRMSRQQEKDQLQNLNDRLAGYIDRVRQLETENQRLSVQIRQTEEVVVRERSNIRAAFEAELADARRMLDELAKDKAKLQIEAGKFKAQYDELHGRFGKLERDFKDSESKRLYAESQVQDLQGKLNTSDNQRKHWEDEAKKLRAEHEATKKQLHSAQQQLEEETLMRVDVENRLQSLREELAFNKQLHESELDESRRKRHLEITEINRELEDDYKQKLQEALQEIRDQFDAQLRVNRQEIEAMYESKMSELRDAADRNRDSTAAARDDVKRMRVQIDSLEKEKNRFEGMVSGLEKKIKDLEDQLRVQQEDFYSRLTTREEEIRRLQQQIAGMMQEYQDLMDTKIQLDVEIEAYRRLLEGEEQRLHLSPSSAQETPTRMVQRGAKRKRVLAERETEVYTTFLTNGKAEGDVAIEDHDTDTGTFVKLQNKGDKDVPLGGWILRREAAGNEVTYKFHAKFVLKAKRSVTVWSFDSKVTHAPPNDLVMKNQKWPVGDKIRSGLSNEKAEEVAWRESIRSSNSEQVSYRTGLADEGLEAADADQRCSIM